MVRAALYSLTLVLVNFPATVSASLFPHVPHSTIEFVFHTSGMDLVEKIDAALNRSGETQSEFKSVVATTPEEARLIHDFDRMLERAFDELARRPSKENLMWAANQLYFIFASHVGSELLNSEERQRLVADTIFDFIKPHHPRDPTSCMTILDPRHAGTVH